jgi:mRNA-degrading endonuclease RelE of RelBE toxin-antitoxin system
MTKNASVNLLFADEFRNQIRSLAKRYRHVLTDIQPLIEQLQNGIFPGDRIAGTGYVVFKVRIKNSDIRKGKRAGYRVIYQICSPSTIILLLIYTKSERSNVSGAELQAIIQSQAANDDKEW